MGSKVQERNQEAGEVTKKIIDLFQELLAEHHLYLEDWNPTPIFGEPYTRLNDAVFGQICDNFYLIKQRFINVAIPEALAEVLGLEGELTGERLSPMLGLIYEREGEKYDENV